MSILIHPFWLLVRTGSKTWLVTSILRNTLTIFSQWHYYLKKLSWIYVVKLCMWQYSTTQPQSLCAPVGRKRKESNGRFGSIVLFSIWSDIRLQYAPVGWSGLRGNKSGSIVFLFCHVLVYASGLVAKAYKARLFPYCSYLECYPWHCRDHFPACPAEEKEKSAVK